MDWFELTLQRLAAQLSHMLEPIAFAIARLGVLLRSYMDGFGLAYPAQTAILTTLWMLALAVTILSLSGWMRLVAVVASALVLAKMYGMLPGG